MVVEKINTTQVEEAFVDYLAEDFNQRIIFTGKFGVGKTTFIKNFFEKRKESYNCIMISPVDYSVGVNEDVFEYIKLDIILELISNFPIEEIKGKLPEDLYLWSFVNNKFESIFDFFLTIVSSLEPSATALKETVDSFNKNYNLYKKYKEELDEKNKTLTETLSNFISKSQTKIGSIFENDIITKSIRIYLEYIKSDKKQNIFIIDDFDRIDPDHIFRIFNILSVHSDYLRGSYTNKFGFDKVIVVCDIDSIEKYYYHKYGEDANFSGFIDKFSSSFYFRYMNKNAIKAFCNSDILKRTIPEKCRIVLSKILEYLVEKDYLQLRNVLKFNFRNQEKSFIISEGIDTGYKKHCKSCTFFAVKEFCIDTTDFPFLQAIAILVNVVGDYDKLIEICIELGNSNNADYLTLEEINIFSENLALLKHLCRFENDVENFLYKKKQGPSGIHHGQTRSTGIHIENPFVHYCNENIEIQLKWTKDNKYDGSDSYFEDVKLRSRNASTIRLIKNHFGELGEILKFLKKKFGYKVV